MENIYFSLHRARILFTALCCQIGLNSFRRTKTGKE
jgi:hypothetical protein